MAPVDMRKETMLSTKAGLPLLAVLLAACGPAVQRQPDIAIDQAWALATVPGKSATAAYLVLRNRGGASDSLVAVTISSGSAAMHRTTMDAGIMRMRMLDRLEIPAGQAVGLKPGATHLMLTQLAEPLAAGDRIELRLRFEKSGEKIVLADVRDAAGAQK